MAESGEQSTKLDHTVISLPHKPTAPLWYGFARGGGRLAATHFVVFLNGLISSQSAWKDAIDKLFDDWEEHDDPNHPSVLTYDRYGQGQSSPDPYDDTHEFGHDLHEVIKDLGILVPEIWKLKNGEPVSSSTPKLVFVGNSIGCVVGRFFAQVNPGAVSALLFLDSNMANSDQVSLFPDPDAPGFDPGTLPEGATVAELRDAREKYREMFGPDVRNAENLDRRNVAELLPYSDRPALVGTGGRGPWIAVVGHDPEKFAQDSADGSLHCPEALTNAYVNPAWARYNEGLVRLTDGERAEGPIIAEHCGHVIQKDDPALVARLLQVLLDKVDSDS